MRLSLLLTISLLAGCQPATPSPPPQGNAVEASLPAPIASKHLPNAFRVHEKVISGGLPASDAAFAELQALGVRTIISVDGAKPDVTSAARFGLRYVHLPHGYDGIPGERTLELAQAVTELPGLIYIHCHHGKHRSPAAAAVACIGAGWLEQEAASPILEAAGTSPHYRGLYFSAANALPFSKEQLSAAHPPFPAVVEPSPLAEAMVALERTHDHLEQLRKHHWRPLRQQPDLDAAHEALLLREHFTEMLRTTEVQEQPERFADMLLASEQDSIALEKAIAENAPLQAAAALARVSRNCTTCHAAFRDVPLNEK